MSDGIGVAERLRRLNQPGPRVLQEAAEEAINDLRLDVEIGVEHENVAVSLSVAELRVAESGLQISPFKVRIGCIGRFFSSSPAPRDVLGILGDAIFTKFRPVLVIED